MLHSLRKSRLRGWSLAAMVNTHVRGGNGQLLQALCHATRFNRCFLHLYTRNVKRKRCQVDVLSSLQCVKGERPRKLEKPKNIEAQLSTGFGLADGMWRTMTEIKWNVFYPQLVSLRETYETCKSSFRSSSSYILL